MKDLEKLKNASSILSFDSDLMIAKNDEYLDYIKPLFSEKFPNWEYRQEYESMYGEDVKIWLKKQKKKFERIFGHYLYFINEDWEILDRNLNWNDSILGKETDEYALFLNLDSFKNFNPFRIGIITYLRKI